MKTLFLILLLATFGASADTLIVELTAPADRSDNAVLTQGEIAGYKLYISQDVLFYPETIPITGDVTPVEVPTMTHTGYVLFARTVDTGGRASENSQVVIIPQAPPKAPPNPPGISTRAP